MKLLYQFLNVCQKSHRNLLLTWAVVALLSAALFFSMLTETQQQQKQLLIKHEQLQNDYAQALSYLAKADVSAEILRHADINLRQTLTSQQMQLEEQARMLEFYDLLMKGGKNKTGLALNSYRLWPEDIEKGLYGFQFVFVQYAKKHYVIKAKLSIDIIGSDELQSENIKNYPLSALLIVDKAQENANNVKSPEKLKFKYFQKVEGLLTLPKGFNPQELKLAAKSRNKRVKAWQKTVPWLVKE